LKIPVIIINTLLIFFLISSCTLKTVKVKEEEEDEALFLLSVIQNYNDSFDNVEGSALVVYKEGERTLSLKAGIIAIADLSNIRIDVEDFVFKKKLVTVAKNGDDVLTVNHIKKTYIQSNYSNLDFKKALGFDIPAELLINFIIGRVPVAEGSYEGDISRRPKLYIQGKEDKEMVFFNRELLPEKIEYYQKDEHYTVIFSKFQNKNETYFPQKIAICSGNKSLEISYTRLNINTKLSSSVFNIEDISLEGFTTGN